LDFDLDFDSDLTGELPLYSSRDRTLPVYGPRLYTLLVFPILSIKMPVWRSE